MVLILRLNNNLNTDLEMTNTTRNMTPTQVSRDTRHTIRVVIETMNMRMRLTLLELVLMLGLDWDLVLGVRAGLIRITKEIRRGIVLVTFFLLLFVLPSA